MRRDRHFDRALGHVGPSRRRPASHRARRQALSPVARRDHADARRRCRGARRPRPRAVEGGDARRARRRSTRATTTGPPTSNRCSATSTSPSRAPAPPMTISSEVREIETLYLDMIAAAKRFIYFENQYFTSGKIAAAIATRMAEDDPPEIVMVMPRTADGWLEQQAMDAARLQIGGDDRQGRPARPLPRLHPGDEGRRRHLRPRQGVDPRRPAAARRLVEPQQPQPGARQRVRRDRRCRATPPIAAARRR